MTPSELCKHYGFPLAAAAFRGVPESAWHTAVWRAFALRGAFLSIDSRGYFRAPEQLTPKDPQA